METSPAPEASDGALAGLRILELGQLLAGPMAATLLSDFGADVIHLEKPGTGDPMRIAGPSAPNGEYVWWKVTMRNKRSVTLDISDPRTRDVLARLVSWADVLVENFRPGTLERWGIGPDYLHQVNPRLVVLRVSGFGQRGPNGGRPGFGKIGEATSGVVALTGFPDGPPVHVGFSLADTITGLMGALGIMMAVYNRDMHAERSQEGEVIDLALYETLFRLIEWQIPAFDHLGYVGSRHGNRNAFAPAAVANVHLTKDKQWVSFSTATVRSVRNCVEMMGLPVEDYSTKEQQLASVDEIDARLKAWVAERNRDDVLTACQQYDVVASPVYNVVDILSDATYAARENIVRVQDEAFGETRQPAPVPHFARRRGRVSLPAQPLGAQMREVLSTIGGLSEDELEAMVDAGLA